MVETKGLQWVTVEFSARYELMVEGPEGDKAPIQCYGCFGTLLSFESVATQLFVRLMDYFGSVSLHDYRYNRHRPIPGLEHRSFVYKKAKIGLFHGVIQNKLDSVMAEHAFNIAVLVCDADIVPIETIDICNRVFDLVVVPSRFCQTTFIKSGLTTDTLIIPHGVSDAFQNQNLTLPRIFTFYNVYSQMRPYRKGEEELIYAFVKAFDLDPKVQLLLRTQLGNDLDTLLDELSAKSVVKVIEDELLESEYVKQFNQVHCVVHPSKAEGFGMIPLQALACGTPVIAPKITGLADYLSSNNALLLNPKGKVAALGDAGEMSGGKYHGIDQDHLVKCLQEMHQNWKREKQKATQCASIIQQKYHWGEVIKPLIDVIESRL